MTKRPLYSDGNEYERQSPSPETSPDEIRRQIALELVCDMFRFTDSRVRQLLMDDIIQAAKLFERYLENG